MADLKQVLLDALAQGGVIENSEQFAASIEKQHQEVVGALKSLESLDYVKSSSSEEERWGLTDEARTYLEAGTPEAQVVIFVLQKGPAGLPQPELAQSIPQNIMKVGFSQAMKNKWLLTDKSKQVSPAPALEVTAALTPEQAKELMQGKDATWKALKGVAAWEKGAAAVTPETLEDLKKRKLVKKDVVKLYRIEKGPSFSTEVKKPQADLTAQALLDGSWEKLEYKKYNFNAEGQTLPSGHLHPLLKVRREFRNVLLLMGFEEMPTNRWVESSFWNFDSLFQPQQHPARDAHDTFFLTRPELACKSRFPPDYFDLVKKTHEDGGFGSIGWRYDWSEDEARKNLLRTHTTSVSARMLYKLAQDVKKAGKFTPKKYFSIDRVFRNETLDATHLAEFHQVEGLVADVGLSLGHLIGTIKDFFQRIGITNLRFKPAYNPYTEPSMEIFGFHPMLNKWVEIGNSGVFRPEMLRPMGLPADVNVVAWGLSLERPTMIQYGIPNIRELFGHKVNLQELKTNPVCWL
uniref:phenylalanine--tRNA ligase n=1 Tax=Chromera velia CCMP2878 TaxID=1169474 RepID=A0A0K6S8K5_9ALVE|mmetsp:Transcript_16502/g.33605  ORF Transcript_16502/g.33605 Transcript_16502/m.33605 type:complete len:519 (+) Transcript_16502:130-1686(+)|eukprot:Cvel_5984.t1-p1 / transcript=Cvel_5984.t1 / gene=Cvel_5984 / organism=Chromera_velia_CCMP2878 / gene_product=Probable phenylalanine--tRNA ligase alpha subunit, putative / transcript_product=Probable phenylalanine--tRNA ligase alpha subunit, putative / location=Cvel_scaffold286:91939-96206(+) / protein_length=518 / sequence_SO=supercontig / SO=protein_coding / is_pseudo=false